MRTTKPEILPEGIERQHKTLPTWVKNVVNDYKKPIWLYNKMNRTVYAIFSAYVFFEYNPELVVPVTKQRFIEFKSLPYHKRVNVIKIYERDANYPGLRVFPNTSIPHMRVPILSAEKEHYREAYKQFHTPMYMYYDGKEIDIDKIDEQVPPEDRDACRRACADWSRKPTTYNENILYAEEPEKFQFWKHIKKQIKEFLLKI